MKRVLCLVVLYAGICAALFAQDADKKSDESKTDKTYKIGDIGPAGGIVFYDIWKPRRRILTVY